MLVNNSPVVNLSIKWLLLFTCISYCAFSKNRSLSDSSRSTKRFCRKEKCVGFFDVRFPLPKSVVLVCQWEPRRSFSACLVAWTASSIGAESWSESSSITIGAESWSESSSISNTISSSSLWKTGSVASSWFAIIGSCGCRTAPWFSITVSSGTVSTTGTAPWLSIIGSPGTAPWSSTSCSCCGTAGAPWFAIIGSPGTAPWIATGCCCGSWCWAMASSLSSVGMPTTVSASMMSLSFNGMPGRHSYISIFEIRKGCACSMPKFSTWSMTASVMGKVATTWPSICFPVSKDMKLYRPNKFLGSRTIAPMVRLFMVLVGSSVTCNCTYSPNSYFKSL